MLKLIVLAVVLRLLVLNTCTSMSVSKRGQVKLCGRMLAETLNLLCEGQYYDPEDENDIEKRSYAPQGRDLYPAWFLGPSHRLNPYAHMAHLPALPSGRRQRRGVVDECCAQPCSPTVLLSYCGTGK